MAPILYTETTQLSIIWDDSSGIIQDIKNHNALEGVATHIQGEVFFYQYELDIPFNGEEKEIFEPGDVVYWRSSKETGKFGILFMYGNTTYGDGTKPRTSSPGIKIGHIANHAQIATIKTGTTLKLG